MPLGLNLILLNLPIVKTVISRAFNIFSLYHSDN
jgi:hypothetical protein